MTNNRRKTLVVDVQVRFKDIDLMGHVNNSVFYTYFEEARIEFFKQVAGIKDEGGYNFILAHSSCDYKKPIRMNDQIKVHVWVSAIGSKSFTFNYKITGKLEDSVIYAQGQTVQVFYDYQKRVTTPIPESFRNKVSPYTET